MPGEDCTGMKHPKINILFIALVLTAVVSGCSFQTRYPKISLRPPEIAAPRPVPG